jgi:LPS sulfotransferase NodH
VLRPSLSAVLPLCELSHTLDVVNIPLLLRSAIQSVHADALRGFFGQLEPKPGWVPPDVDVLFICFTNRCGSNYFAHLLATTGAFNEAGEFFNSPTVAQHAAALALKSLPAYFSALPTLVPHTGGRLAAKASIDQLVMLADAGILDALGSRVTYLLIEREDRLGQAISRVIAAQNLRWTTAHTSTVPDNELVFQRGWIKQELAEIAVMNAAFFQFFSANNIVPVRITYEKLLVDPRPALAALAKTMRLGELQPRPENVTIRRQANALNAAWRRAYLAPT